MNAERSPDTLAQFTKVFTYRPSALRPYWLACGAVAVVAGFFLWVAAQWEALTLSIFLFLSLPPVLILAYTLYLWVVAKTAMLVVTEHGIVYSDRWVRRALLWSEIAAFTRSAIRSRKGKNIALKLGIKALDNWQELLAIAREYSDAHIAIG